MWHLEKDVIIHIASYLLVQFVLNSIIAFTNRWQYKL